MNRKDVLRLTAFFIVSAVGGMARADELPSIDLLNQQAANPDIFTFDYGVPSSPALTLAGLAEGTLKPSTSLKPFVLSLPGLLNGGSQSSSSAALDISPAWALSSNGIMENEYESAGAVSRIWDRTRLGFVLYKGDSADGVTANQKPSRLALGLSTSLLDGSDPIMSGGVWKTCTTVTHRTELEPYRRFSTTDQLSILRDEADWPFKKNDASFVKQVESHLRAANVKIDTTGMTAADELSAVSKALETYKDNAAKSQGELDYYATFKTALDGCRKAANDAAQHGFDLGIGAGVVWSGTPGELKDFTDPNAAVWISGRAPLSFLGDPSLPCEPAAGSSTRSEASCWTIGGSGRYSAGEMVQTGDTTTPQFKANVAQGWLGIERTDSKSKFGAYVGYLDQSAVDFADKAFSRSGTRWLVSGSYSLDSVMKGLWLVGSYGAANGSVTTLDDKVALLSLTFAPPSVGSGFVTSSSTSSTATPATPPANP